MGKRKQTAVPATPSLCEIFGMNVRLERVRAGTTQEDFAAAVGTDQARLSLIERGKAVPALDLVERIAAELELTPGEMMYERLGRRL